MPSELEKLKQFFRECGVNNIKSFMDTCSHLKNILMAENKKYNLTRINETSDYWNKHIADSLSITLFFPELKNKHLKLADIGCGAGFPSLVLAIAFNNLAVTAIDSIRKKTNFVTLAAEELALNNVNVIWGRARELKIYREFDYITARAVADPAKIFKETRKLVNKNGKIVVYKTLNAEATPLETLNKFARKYSYIWKQTNEFPLPNGDKRIFTYSVPTETTPQVPQT